MSVLSKFITTQLLKDFEREFVSHMPAVQEKLLEELTAFSNLLVDWIESKFGDSAPMDK